MSQTSRIPFEIAKEQNIKKYKSYSYTSTMTLGILVATSTGVVICTDSLVTTSQTHTVLKDPNNRISLPDEIWDYANDGEVGIATPRSNLTNKGSIIATSPNVKKMFQIGSHPIAFTLAGENNWNYTLFNNEGFPKDFRVPLESYVNTVVQKVIENLPDDSNFEDIVKCLAFTLNFGHLQGNKDYSESDILKVYTIMGSGYGTNDAFPRSFRYAMPGGQFDRQSTLNACSVAFCTGLSATFIQSCYSTNWFDQYCQDDLIAAIDAAHAQAWVWGMNFGWSPETIIENLIPLVNKNIINGLMILREFTFENPHDFLQRIDLSTPQILSKFWNSLAKTDGMDEISMIVNQSNNVTPRMLEIIQTGKTTENVYEDVYEERKNIATRLMNLYPLEYDEQSDKIKKSISRKGFNSMSRILAYLLPSCMHSLCQISGDHSSEKIEFYGKMWTGLDYVGNAEVLQKITNGLDEKTFYNISDDIKSYQMHAAERLATIISHSIQSQEAPEYVKFGTPDRDNEGEVKEEKSIQSTLPIEPQLEVNGSQSNKIDLSGKWKGFHTNVDPTSGSAGKSQFELEIRYSEDNTFFGESSSTSISDVVISNGVITEGNIIEFDMIVEGNQLSKIRVDCVVKTWGIEGSFEIDGTRQDIIMHRYDKNSTIDSEKLTADALNQLVRELEKFYPKSQGWDVNYTTLPLENAVNLAHYLMNSTVMKQRFNLELPSVGGPIRTLIITREEGLQRLEDYII